jgi:hypothetical protein
MFCSMSPKIISRLFASPSENMVEALVHDIVPDGKPHVVITASGTGRESVRIDTSVATTDYIQGCPVEHTQHETRNSFPLT